MDVNINPQEDLKKNQLCKNLKDQVYAGKLKQINSFEYSCFKFKFNINNIQYQKEFANFIHFQKLLLPWDILNWFERRNIKCSISFRRCSGIGLKTNLILLKTTLFLKKETFLIRIKRKLRGLKYEY